MSNLIPLSFKTGAEEHAGAETDRKRGCLPGPMACCNSWV